MLLGITGKAGAGKDTTAEIIARQVSWTSIYHFADPLKLMALAINPIIEIGHNPDGSVHVSRLAHLVDYYGWQVAKGIPEVRRTLQRLGTEGARATFGDNCWVDLMRDWYYSLEPFATGVIPDTRFPNEANAIWQEGGKIIRVERPDAYDLGTNAAHASEQVLDADLTIVNDGGIGELEVKVRAALKELGYAQG